MTQKKKVGTIAPKKFIARLKKENELFDNFMQQDAHEFLNYLLNSVADLLQVWLPCVETIFESCPYVAGGLEVENDVIDSQAYLLI